MMGQADVLSTARMVAQTGSTTPLRAAAIATVADLGDETDIELLESMTVAEQKRVAKTATLSLARLMKRVGK